MVVVTLLVVGALYWRAVWQVSAPDEPVERIVGQLERINDHLCKIAAGLRERLPEHGLVCASDVWCRVLDFDFDRSEVSEQGKKALAALAKQLGSAPRAHDYVVVEGHATSVGDASYNLDLSERRAEAVAKELKNSLSSHWHQRLIIVSRGERHDETSLNKDDNANQKVRVALCTPRDLNVGL